MARSRARIARLLVVIGLLTTGCSTSAALDTGDRSAPVMWPTWVLSDPGEIHVPPAGDSPAELTLSSTHLSPETLARYDRQPAFAPWVEEALDYVAHRTKDPPAASRAYALVTIAIHDAAVASRFWQEEHGSAPVDGYPSTNAAIAGAAAEMLAFLFPEQPEAWLSRMAEEAAVSRVSAGASSATGVAAGLTLGQQIAGLVIERRDAEVVVVRGVDGQELHDDLPSGPEHWAPPPGSMARPASPDAGSWQTWLMDSGAQFRPEPPPRFGSAEFLAEAEEVVAVSEKLTDEQRRAATFWEGPEGSSLPPGIWNEVALAYLAEADLDLLAAARAMALLNVAMDDAAVAAWDAKYAYWSPRPENAIRDLGLDPDWAPYVETPFFPAYVSGHAAYSGAASVVMSHLFPAAADLFEARAREATDSRLFGGIHFRSDNEVGFEMGTRIGELAVRWDEATAR
jgi:membrane-associated phospholipid phosphatase